MLDKAFAHSLGEIGLHTLWESLKTDFEPIRNGHDSIHEFIYIAPLMFPKKEAPSWHKRSAFLVYHWEIGDAVHRSFLEALCGYYNAAFVLLRTAVELVVKGAFYEGLAHREFRDRSLILQKDPEGSNLTEFIDQLISDNPSVAEDLEETSAAIYDKLETVMEQRKYQPAFRVMLEQLLEWGLVRDIDLFKDVYRRLSKDVHVIPDYTDIGRVLLSEAGRLFGSREVNQRVLTEYIESERFIVDNCTVTELNILRDNLAFPEVRSNLAGRVQYLKELGMTSAAQTAVELLGKGS